MKDLAKQAEPALSNLLQSEEDQLLEELGIRAKAMEKNLAVSASFTPEITHDAATMGVLDDVREVGRRIFNRWNREAHKLICGADDLDKKDREELVKAFGLGDAAVAGVITGLLVTQFAVAPAIAAVIAALVIKRFFTPAYEEFCQFWQESLPAQS